MSDVNEVKPPHPATAPSAPPVRKRPMGKQKLPVERRRVILSVRVLPSTKQYLEKMNYATAGRALDMLVKAVQHRGIQKMIDGGEEVAIVNIAG